MHASGNLIFESILHGYDSDHISVWVTTKRGSMAMIDNDNLGDENTFYLFIYYYYYYFDERLNNEKKKTEYSIIEHITKISYGVRCGPVRPFDRSITLLSFGNRLLCDDNVGYELLDEI